MKSELPSATRLSIILNLLPSPRIGRIGESRIDPVHPVNPVQEWVSAKGPVRRCGHGCDTDGEGNTIHPQMGIVFHR